MRQALGPMLVPRSFLLLLLPLLAGTFFYLQNALSLKHAGLFAIGIALGVTLFHGSFGFTGAYRKAIVDRDISGVTAQLIMLGLAMLLFAPVLSEGQVFGHGVSGSVAPVSVSMAFGAFLFGIGMQLGGSCASGTLFTVGGGNIRMMLVLLFFCVGAFWGSLDLRWWMQLPSMGGVSLGKKFGWPTAIAMQLAMLSGVYLLLRGFWGKNKRGIWKARSPEQPFSIHALWRGPWPLVISGTILALLNWATVLVAGHAWSITWAFSLWGAKLVTALGWDPSQSGFWSGRFQANALARPVWMDNTSLMNIGIIVGALLASLLANKISTKVRIPLRSLAAAVIGGLMMGYGARLAYGCNIGALFSGIASTSLHGWVWILCAIPGNLIGIKLRPFFQIK